jgi:F0F1-type ATP synthase assembly protein I
LGRDAPRFGNIIAPWKDFGMPEIDSEMHAEVATLKSAHSRWRERTALALTAEFIVGIVVGACTWFAQAPIDRDAVLVGGVLGLGATIFFIGSMITRVALPKPETRCPRCGHDWKGSVPVDDWLTWEYCPGCGLKLNNTSGEL